MIDLLLGASAAGGIVFLLWLLTYPLSKKYFKASWHYAVLKMTMAFMIVPIGIFAPMFGDMLPGLPEKPDMPDVSEKLQAIKIDAEAINTANAALSKIVFPAGNRFSSPPKTEEKINGDTGDIKNPAQPERNPIDIPYLQIIWLVAAALLFAGGTRKMRKFKKHILKFSGSDVGRETSELFLQCKRQLKVRGQITLRTSGYIKTPLTFGLIRPFVVFPETDMTAEEKRIALIHELTHIKNGDLWIKFIAFVISAVHWFNPFTHLLNRKISVISEEYCDECAIKTMTKEERFSYGNLILKVVCDISAPQAKFCSTLSAPTKNLKRRLSNMINTKKSRRGMVALSVLAALILCSFATIYAFAANAATPTNLQAPENPLSSLPEAANVNIADTEKDVNFTIAGTLGIGYTDTNGESTGRYSRDGGLTWYTDDDILDPDISAIEQVSYGEFKAWIDEKRMELSDDDIAYYEAELEDVRNGVGEAGKVIIENRAIIFVFYTSEYTGDKATYAFGDGENFCTYSQEEMDEWLAQYEFIIGILPTMATVVDGQVIYAIGEGDGIMANFNDSYGYWWVRDGGEYYYTDGDDTMGFCATTYKELYKIVKEFFDGQVEAGKMTQTEADGLLAGLTQDSTRLTFDSEGNRIK